VVVHPLFELELLHGRAIALEIPQGDPGALEGLVCEDERSVAAGLAPARRRTWIAGRAALRLALERLGLAAPQPVLADDRGAPVLPAMILGSISHKEHVALALVAHRNAGDARVRIGVDVELDGPTRIDIARHVLTPGELSELQPLSEQARGSEVKLRFSAKEALYKALDPFVRRYVGFREVTVQPRADGSARVELRLPASEGSFDAEVTWVRREGLVVTTARVRAC
jgi:4'-phosphopantetheinyl transferase EntD